MSGGGPIVGHEYLRLLEEYHPKIKWDARLAEHSFSYASDRQHLVYYPTLMSIATRLEEAQTWGASISIWELGQGLPYFYDLL